MYIRGNLGVEQEVKTDIDAIFTGLHNRNYQTRRNAEAQLVRTFMRTYAEAYDREAEREHETA